MMAYYDVSLLAGDIDFNQRIAACATIEGIVGTDETSQGWASDHAWQLAATPSFGDKYAYALETGVVNPGRQQSVISDGDILSAVQAIGIP